MFNQILNMIFERNDLPVTDFDCIRQKDSKLITIKNHSSEGLSSKSVKILTPLINFIESSGAKFELQTKFNDNKVEYFAILISNEEYDKVNNYYNNEEQM